MTPSPSPPPPRPTLDRTPFDRWLWERGYTNIAAAEELSVIPETVRRWRLPFSDPLRRIPDEEAMERIFEFTAGEIPPAAFYQVGAPATAVGA